MPSNEANPGQQDMNSIFSIDRVCAVFEVHHHNVPGAKFKIKVLERSLGDFLAVPNVVAREADGTPDHVSGLGSTSREALDDLLGRLTPWLSAANPDEADRFEWSDPRDF